MRYSIIYVRTYVRTYVCVYVCMCICVHVCMHVICMYIWRFHTYVRMFLRVLYRPVIYMYVCMYVRTVCIYVPMYVCMCCFYACTDLNVLLEYPCPATAEQWRFLMYVLCYSTALKSRPFLIDCRLRSSISPASTSVCCPLGPSARQRRRMMKILEERKQLPYTLCSESLCEFLLFVHCLCAVKMFSCTYVRMCFLA